MGLLRSLGFAERGVAGVSGVRTKSRYSNSLTNAAVCELRKPAHVDAVLPAPGASLDSPRASEHFVLRSRSLARAIDGAIGVARTNSAVSKEQPNLGPGGRSDYSVLQQHVQFFDRDGDEIITPTDTFVGFRRIGFGRAISLGAAIVIHSTFSFATWPNALPRLTFPIYVSRMHRTKHGSDSGVYDTEGRFIPQKFEDIFSKFDASAKGGLDWDDIQDMVYANMNVNDMVGWVAGRLEWWVLWLAAADSKGVISKEKVRAMFDGTLWELLAKEQTAKRGYEIFPLRTSKSVPSPRSTKAGEVKTPAKPSRESATTDGSSPLVGKKLK